MVGVAGFIEQYERKNDFYDALAEVVDAALGAGYAAEGMVEGVRALHQSQKAPRHRYYSERRRVLYHYEYAQRYHYERRSRLV